MGGGRNGDSISYEATSPPVECRLPRLAADLYERFLVISTLVNGISTFPRRALLKKYGPNPPLALSSRTSKASESLMGVDALSRISPRRRAYPNSPRVSASVSPCSSKCALSFLTLRRGFRTARPHEVANPHREREKIRARKRLPRPCFAPTRRMTYPSRRVP